MSEDDLINLKHLVDNHEEELTDQTKVIEELKERVSVLERDVKTVVMLCHRLRVFKHLHPGLEAEEEKFSVEISPLILRYQIDPLA
jgi:hypothetical protein